MATSRVPHYLSMGEVAERTGLAESSVRTYRSRGGMPEPDVMVGRTPGWLPATIDEWAKTLPGRGARTDLVGKDASV
jgi:predicted DNA-binding transcriptional regulator AlpA